MQKSVQKSNKKIITKGVRITKGETKGVRDNFPVCQPDALGQPTELGIQNVNTYVYSVSHYPDGHIAAFTWTSGLVHQVTK